MVDPIITNNDLGSVVIADARFRDETLVFAGAKTLAVGTILGRVVASGKYKDYVVAGAGGEEVPKAVLLHEVVATGAGDIPTRVMVVGEVRREKLIIDLDGDDSNITAAIIDQLRDYGIIATTVQELNIQDNQ